MNLFTYIIPIHVPFAPGPGVSRHIKFDHDSHPSQSGILHHRRDVFLRVPGRRKEKRGRWRKEAEEGGGGGRWEIS